MGNRIYLIRKLWLDSMENKSHNAVGYAIIGYVSTKEDAIEFCSRGKIFNKSDCWALFEDTPEYDYSEIAELTNVQ